MVASGQFCRTGRVTLNTQIFFGLKRTGSHLLDAEDYNDITEYLMDTFNAITCLLLLIKLFFLYFKPVYH